MVIYVFDSFQRGRHFFPARDPAIQLRKIGFEIFVKSLLMLRKIARKTRSNVLSSDLSVSRVQHVVRVSFRVKVSLRSVQAQRSFNRRNPDRTIDIARLPREDFRVAGNFQKRREPRMLVIEPGQDKHVRPIQPRYKAGPHGNAMRVLDSSRETIHIDQLFANLPGDISQIREGRHNPDLLGKDWTCLKPTEREKDEKYVYIVLQ